MPVLSRIWGEGEAAGWLFGYSALTLGLGYRTYIGLTAALILSTASLFCFLYAKKVPARLSPQTKKQEVYLYAVAGTTLFAMINLVTKVVLPLSDDPQTLDLSIAILLTGSLTVITVFFSLERLSGHRAFIEDLANFEGNASARDGYERVGNAVLLGSIMIALDAFDIMLFATALVVSISQLRKLSQWLLTHRAKRRSHGLGPSRASAALASLLDLDKGLWLRVRYVVGLKRGVPLFLLAFIASIPAIVYSYSLDLLMPDLGRIAVFGLLGLPGILILYSVSPKQGKGRRGKERVRGLIVSGSVLAPLSAIAIVAYNRDLLPGAAEAVAFDPSLSGLLTGFVWLAIFPATIGLPLFYAIRAIELNDFPRFTRWARVFSIAPMPVTAGLTFLAEGLSIDARGANPHPAFYPPVFLSLLALAISLASFCYATFIAVFLEAVRTAERRSAANLRVWKDRLAGPHWQMLLLAAGIGAGFFPLAIIVDNQLPPGFSVVLHEEWSLAFWFLGGFASVGLTCLLQQPRSLLRAGARGIAAAAGPVGLSLLFFDVLRDPIVFSLWAPWIAGIPLGFATGGTVASVIMARTLRRS